VRRTPVPILLALVLALPVGVMVAAPRSGDRPPPTRPTPAVPEPQRPAPPARVRPAPPPRAQNPLPRRPSRAVGVPWAGRLVRGRLLPIRGPGYDTWDPIRKQVPNRGWRRWGTSRLVRIVRRVLAAYARRHRGAPPVLVGDLSRPRGGDFGPRYGGIGHASHQNGLDVDVYYPRRDGRLRAARRPEQVDRDAAQQLVDAFARVGAEKIFVGPSLALHGPPRVVHPLVHHDDHLHVRLRGT
jgi:murein endopeptidase